MVLKMAEIGKAERVSKIAAPSRLVFPYHVIGRY